MLHPVKYFILFISLPLYLFPQSIQQIQVTGNRIFSANEIIKWSGVYTGAPYYEGLTDSAKYNIAFQLSDRGYHHASFEDTKVDTLSDSTRLKLNLYVNEGEPTIINKIIINDSDSLPVSVRNNFRFLERDVFNVYDLQESINNSLTYFENNAYPFTKIKIASIYFYTDTISGTYYADIQLNINREIKSVIDKVEITGNTSIKDYVIVRELRLQPGEAYSQNKIEELPRSLNRLRFFEPVAAPTFFINSNNEGVLLIDVKEKQTNNFDGIIGYIPPRNDDEKGYLTGLVNVSMRNLFGTGRAAAVRWQQYDRFSQELELKYLEPWILSYPFNISGGYFQRKQDTTYVQRKMEGAVEYLATEEISASVFLGSETVIPTENIVPRFTVYNSNSVTTGVNLKIDTRDDPYSPTGGLLFINSYSFSKKKIYGPLEFITPATETSIDLQRFAVDISGFYELFSRQVVSLGVHGRELRGSFFENSDLFRLGGTNTLRGYREDQFLGSRILWTNLEYRLLLTRRTYTFLFFDTGYYVRTEDPARNIFKQEDFTFGYGLGLNLETALGVLGVSFALAEGDSFSEGKIHFGLVNEF